MTKPVIVVVDDDALFRDVIADLLDRDGFPLRLADSLAAARAALRSPSVIVLDQRLPDGLGIDFARELTDAGMRHRILMVTGHPAIADAVDGLKLGIDDYIEKPVNLERLRLAVLRAAEAIRLDRTARLARRRNKEDRQRSRLVGSSLDPVRGLIETAASSRCNVLITGETGTGKSLVAKAIHHASNARDALVQINCATLPAPLVEAELFGVEKGAFTGADRARQGLFAYADGGALFLDEIGELESAIQAKLLDVLERGAIRPVGAVRERQVDVRIIAATNADLDSAIRTGRFRRDLYFRFAVLKIHLQPLRERIDDLPDLTTSLLAEVRPGTAIELAPGELDRLRRYAWPGNVRELRNVLERAVILHPGNALRPSAFLGDVDGQAPAVARHTDPAWGHLRWTLEELTDRYIARVIEDCGGNRSEAARRLGIGLSTLRRRLNQRPVKRPPTPDREQSAAT